MLLITAMVSVLLLFSCARQGEQKTGYVAKVGSTTITEEDVNRELKALPEQIQKIFEGPEGTERFVNELIKKEVLYQEAKKKGLDKSPDYQRKVEEFRKLTLISQLLEKEIEEKVKVSEKDLKEYYEANKKDFTANNQVRASHILVKTEEEARDIIEQLKKGVDFAKIARAKSIDKGSAQNGGDLGFFSRGQMVPEFESAAFNLKVGEISRPVRTQYGYHIIKVTERREGNVIEFEKVKGLLTQRLTAEKQKEAFDSYINNLMGSYRVDINKDALLKMGGKADSRDKPDQPASKP